MTSSTIVRRTRLTLAPVLLLLVASVWPAHAASQADYGVAVMRDVMVPMRDGVEMATDVYLPTDATGAILSEKVPTVLTRTPYDKEGSQRLGHYFASRGYAVVAQDTRGRYKSDGVWDMLNDDGRDGFDACAWIGTQT